MLYFSQKYLQDDGPYRNQNETIDLALNLNLDPRKPGQALRGSTSLPYGTGKKVSILVFASEDATIKAATEAGATAAGGASLVESIARGEVPVDFDRALATPDMMPSLSKIARILGPRGLMPNAKVKTIQPDGKIVDAIKEQAAGSLLYRTDKDGVIHAGIGKGSFTEEELLDNIKSFMNTIQSVKPESFGKGKKGKKKGSTKNAKYYLSAYLSATQSKGSMNINLLTLDVSIKYASYLTYLLLLLSLTFRLVSSPTCSQRALISWDPCQNNFRDIFLSIRSLLSARKLKRNILFVLHSCLLFINDLIF